MISALKCFKLFKYFCFAMFRRQWPSKIYCSPVTKELILSNKYYANALSSKSWSFVKDCFVRQCCVCSYFFKQQVNVYQFLTDCSRREHHTCIRRTTITKIEGCKAHFTICSVKQFCVKFIQISFFNILGLQIKCDSLACKALSGLCHVCCH